jgi:hypothetical protein
MIVNPGFFRTELLTEESDGDVLPQRFIAGVDAISTAEQKVALLQQQIDAQRELSSSLAFDDLPTSAAEASA